MSPDIASVDWASRVGQVTHSIVTGLPPIARDLDPYDLGEQALRLARTLVSDGQILRAPPPAARRRRPPPAARARAVGLSLSYLRDFVPAGGWSLPGTEIVLPGSRIDVAWEHPVHGVLLDEIKTAKGRGAEGLAAADLA